MTTEGFHRHTAGHDTCAGGDRMPVGFDDYHSMQTYRQTDTCIIIIIITIVIHARKGSMNTYKQDSTKE